MKKNNAYLARIVSFDYPTILFKRNELDENIDCEKYRLVLIKGNRAYDLINFMPYQIIMNAMGEVDDRCKLMPNTYYVYQIWPIEEIWENIKTVYNINGTLEEFLESTAGKIDELDNLLNPKDKVIDLNKIRKIIMMPNIDNEK